MSNVISSNASGHLSGSTFAPEYETTSRAARCRSAARVANAVRRVAQVAACGLFLLAIFLPLAAQLAGLSGTGRLDVEGRIGAPFPTIEMRTGGLLPRPKTNDLLLFPVGFEAWYNDHFGFRGPLVASFYQARAQGIVPDAMTLLPALLHKKEATIFGKEGWLFLNTYQTTGSACGMRLFRAGELDDWENALRRRAAWLKARGIDYVLMFNPDKPSIYPEFLPEKMEIAGTKWRLDQLLDRLRATAPDLTIVDTRKTLRAGKSLYPTYYRTDTHWNEYGGYLGYRELIQAMQAKAPALRPSSLSDFEILEQECNCEGDLWRLLGGHLPMSDLHIELRPRQPRQAKITVGAKHLRFNRVQWSQCPSAPLASAVVLHDSFFNSMQAHFSEHFRRVDYLWTFGFPEHEIEQRQPQIVVQEILERFLQVAPPEVQAARADQASVVSAK